MTPPCVGVGQRTLYYRAAWRNFNLTKVLSALEKFVYFAHIDELIQCHWTKHKFKPAKTLKNMSPDNFCNNPFSVFSIQLKKVYLGTFA
jgi:hypothetical protein